jgi:hypothetical protein
MVSIDLPSAPFLSARFISANYSEEESSIFAVMVAFLFFLSRGRTCHRSERIADAERTGLIDDIGPDAVQRMMAEAFGLCRAPRQNQFPLWDWVFHCPKEPTSGLLISIWGLCEL